MVCKTLSYPINHGVTSICMSGTFDNVSESVELFYTDDNEGGIYVYCKLCQVVNSEVTLFCNESRICKMLLREFIMKGNTIRLSNIYIDFINATIEQTTILDMSNNSGKASNQIHFMVSTLSCIEQGNCGLCLVNNNIAKVAFVQSYLDNFRIDISVSQLKMILLETDITLPSFSIKTRSLEYLRIPTIIQFNQVTMVKNGTLFRKEELSLNAKSIEPMVLDNLVLLDLANPYIIIGKSNFTGVHVEIQSTLQIFEPVLFSLLIEKSVFIDSHHMGNGGALTIISEVKNSVVTVSDCVFSNNSVVKGTGNLDGRGGGLFVKGNSLQLIMTNCSFLSNRAVGSGLALYTTEGVDVSLTNSTFHYNVDQVTPDQQCVLFIIGTMIKFHGTFRVFNPKPQLYAGPIDIFYIGQGAHINIETHCPRWYNHHLEYSAVSTNHWIIPDAKYRCTPCSDNYYTTSAELNIVSFYGNNINPEGKLIENKGIGKCIECPYGALCTGNNVMPRPNYWGYWYEGELAFQQCPADYCCSGSGSTICSEYNYCSANRTGTLCGGCQEGFSVSILSGVCTLDNQCGGDQWFWIVVLFATVAYALWYTVKDDIFSFLFSFIEFIKHICCRSNADSVHVHAVSSNRKGTPISKCENDVDINRTSSNKKSPYVKDRAYRNQQVSRRNANKSVDNSPVLSEERNAQDDVSKGYFGIVTYYVQMAAVIRIQIEFSDIDKSEPILDKMVNNIGTLLSIEPTQMSFDVCPIRGMTIVGKHLYKLVFLLGIYVSWAGFFLINKAALNVFRKQNQIRPIVRHLESCKLKLTRGLIEIIKYTYAGLCSIIFMSLVCTQIGNKYVWWYDGTNICLENWQILIVIFAVFYAVPFPFALALGLKLLKQNRISPGNFVLCCLFPLLALIVIGIYICNNNVSNRSTNSALPAASEAMISVLQGSYRNYDKHLTLYWEAMISVRRLLITGMTLVSYASIRMVIISVLSVIFLVQHNYMSPFQMRSSNDVEALSLSLLLLNSMINLLKASLTDSGIVPSGPAVPFFKGLELCEKMPILLIIGYILLLELKSRIKIKKYVTK